MVEYMEATGPDVKRPRLNYDAPPRMASQQHPLPPSPAHQNPSILPAPSSTSHHQQQPPLPPSPFSHEIPHDPRAPVEPSVHSFVQHHSGQTTPRDGRFPHEMNYSRRGSASATPRSPDDHHFPPPRSMSVALPNDAPHYPAQQYSAESTNHLVGYQAPDPHMNGTMSHGLPIHPHGDGGPGMPPAPYTEYGPPPMHPGSHGYAGIPYGGGGPQAQMRAKKGNRAQQACDICRTRKAKCDEGRPRCGFCVENDLQCNYQNVAPAKVDRVNQQIIDQLANTQDDLKTFREEFRVFKEDLKNILSNGGTKIEQHQPSRTSFEDMEVKPSGSQTESPNVSATNAAAAASSTVMASPGGRETKMIDASPSGSFNTSSATYDGPDHTKLNDIAVEHNTAAQKLFRWPSIKRLLEKSRLKESERDENFVMNFELRKGPMRLYGRGQGQEPGESIRIGASAASPAASSTSGLSDEGASPASSADSSWGYGINPYIGEPRTDSAPGGLNPSNTLRLDSKTIDSLLKSYLMHIHIMHPFLDEANLTRMIDSFKRRYGLAGTTAGNANIDSLRDPSSGFSRPSKRKASDGQFFVGDAPAPIAASQSSPNSPLLERSPTTAMVLLILALGKICEYREPLPGPVPINTTERFTYPARSSSPQPGLLGQSPTDSSSIRHSPTSSSHSMVNPPAPSPTVGLLRQNHRSPRSSVGDLPPQVRNLDVIPGLAYYAQATDILGNLTGSTSLVHVQCCILAGLYSGQLANSIESLGWIQNAARTLMVILRVNDPTHKDRRSWPNSVRFAYHTTSQLENDILAEIDLPRVGLEKRDYFPYPDGYVPSEGAPPSQVQQTTYGEIMQSYSSQLHIRGILNQAQYSLYAPDVDMKTAAHRPTVSALDDFLRELRQERLPEDLKWEDSDPPAPGINQARLRGKWYGGQYIVHRPYLHKALELDAEGQLDQYMQRKYEQSAYQAGAMGPPPTTPADPTLEFLLHSAKTCIHAAQLSTLAFDGYSDHRRLTVTNILGTAHAQFGNMLVLSAVYCSKHLKQYISDDPTMRMAFLFRRTINMLKNLKPISATLGHDQYILECLRDVVLKEDDITPPNASFSSN